jgi:HSP20 family protein
MRSLLPFQWGRVRDANTDPFSALDQEIDRVFSDFGAGYWPSFASNTGSAMRLDVSETDDTIEIDAELPGMDEKDVEVVLKDNILTIKGEKTRKGREEKRLPHGRAALRQLLPIDYASL